MVFSLQFLMKKIGESAYFGDVTLSDPVLQPLLQLLESFW